MMPNGSNPELLDTAVVGSAGVHQYQGEEKRAKWLLTGAGERFSSEGTEGIYWSHRGTG